MRRRPYTFARLAGMTILGLASAAGVIVFAELLDAGPSTVALKAAGLILGAVIVGASLKAWGTNR